MKKALPEQAKKPRKCITEKDIKIKLAPVRTRIEPEEAMKWQKRNS